MQKSDINMGILNEVAKLLVNRGATQQQIAGLSDLSKPCMNKYGNQMTVCEYMCYFCGSKDHKIYECPVQQDYIEGKKWIICKDGQLRLKDGNL